MTENGAVEPLKKDQPSLPILSWLWPLLSLAFICCFFWFQITDLQHSVLSPLSFRLDYKRGTTTTPTMFQRQVRMQVNISDITENSAELGTVHAITFTLLSGMLKIENNFMKKKNSVFRSKKGPSSSTQKLNHIFSTTSSTGCSNKFGIHSEMLACEARYVYKKYVFRSKKLLFEPFFLNCKIENGF